MLQALAVISPPVCAPPSLPPAEVLLEWERGQVHKAMRQRGIQGGGVSLAGLSWAIPCGPHLSVTAAGLEHRLPCWGYAFREHDTVLGPHLGLLKVSGGLRA